jgi:REP element-mobilizing transposase RayT
MNRGRGRCTIFHGEKYTNAFLLGLAEAHQLFGIEVLAYCLMGNHYHLLVRTPNANLSRCMRHINGTYTQRYNKLKNTDGSLFRGRYKAILVEVDVYLLQVSRYIHRNPIDTNIPLVKILCDYQLSSYPVYLNKRRAPVWLKPSLILSMIAQRQAYQDFVEHNGDDSVAIDMDLQNQSVILGTEKFVKSVSVYVAKQTQNIPREQLPKLLTLEEIIKRVADHYKIMPNDIVKVNKGRGITNTPRDVAIYLCRYKMPVTLNQIAMPFGLKHYSSVSNAIKRLCREIANDELLKKKVDLLFKDLTP